MVSDLPSDIKKTDAATASGASPLPPSVKVYKPELLGHSTNSFSLLSSKHRNTDVLPPATNAEAQISPVTDEPEVIAVTETVHVSEITDDEPDFAAPAAETADVQIAEELFSEPEEQLPALFAGMNRRRQDDISSISIQEELDAARTVVYEMIDDYFSDDLPFDDEEAETEDEAAAQEVEPEEESEPEDTVDVDELLDFIEEIEFAEMTPEPLRAVRYQDSNDDPYNTAFNEPSASDAPTEFSLDPSFTFEKK